MTFEEAWQWITDNWNTPDWKPIPPQVCKVIPFHPRLGLWGGMLVTQHGIRGVQAFIQRMNEPISGKKT